MSANAILNAAYTQHTVTSIIYYGKQSSYNHALASCHQRLQI